MNIFPCNLTLLSICFHHKSRKVEKAYVIHYIGTTANCDLYAEKMCVDIMSVLCI